MSREMFAYQARAGVDVNLGYLAEVLRSPVARELLFGLVTGTSNRNRLVESGQLLKLPVPRPPSRAEQDLVADLRRNAHKLRGAATRESSEAAYSVGQGWAIDIGSPIADAGEAEAMEADPSEVGTVPI